MVKINKYTCPPLEPIYKMRVDSIIMLVRILKKGKTKGVVRIMKFIVSGKNIEITEALRNRAIKKLGSWKSFLILILMSMLP